MTAPAALFDFDGTIIRRDSTSTLVRHLLRMRPWRAPLVAALALRLKMARSPEQLQRAKNALIGALVRGLPAGRAALAADQAAAALRSCRRAGVIRALRAGADRGWRVVVVSASPGFFLRRAVADLPVEVVATEFAVSGDRFTGAVLGEPCFGPAKAMAVRAHLGAGVVEEAWTDSIQDAAMMRLAIRRCWVCPPADGDEVRRLDADAVIVARENADDAGGARGAGGPGSAGSAGVADA